ncbi:hypothetical protein TSH7_26520 [Azospirillum sp. TSH7]|nr:hypothetical protein TSH7_26520 [Azospirillum sp. TSH7]PWC71316.1 hypothetical protein TSH20_04050 [Azospirillum sp. TSH20]
MARSSKNQSPVHSDPCSPLWIAVHNTIGTDLISLFSHPPAKRQQGKAGLDCHKLWCEFVGLAQRVFGLIQKSCVEER